MSGDVESGRLPAYVKAATGRREEYARILAEVHALDDDVLGAYGRAILGGTWPKEGDAELIAYEEREG